jgi:hypothetical protein
METQTELQNLNQTDAATINHEDTICVEGSTKEICENPELFPVVESLKNLKNKFIKDVREVSNKYGLDGSVKVVFSIYARKAKMEEISLE